MYRQISLSLGGGSGVKYNSTWGVGRFVLFYPRLSLSLRVNGGCGWRRHFEIG